MSIVCLLYLNKEIGHNGVCWGMRNLTCRPIRSSSTDQGGGLGLFFQHFHRPGLLLDVPGSSRAVVYCVLLRFTLIYRVLLSFIAILWYSTAFYCNLLHFGVFYFNFLQFY